jgi:hypothetical protein
MLPKLQFLNSASFSIHLQNPEVAISHIPRLLLFELLSVYHVISRTALVGLSFDGSEKCIVCLSPTLLLDEGER